jgi:hypothetical protein
MFCNYLIGQTKVTKYDTSTLGYIENKYMKLGARLIEKGQLQ